MTYGETMPLGGWNGCTIALNEINSVSFQYVMRLLRRSADQQAGFEKFPPSEISQFGLYLLILHLLLWFSPTYEQCSRGYP
jgi:hypothetical protein